MSQQLRVVLAGCTPEPLLSYLKALGVFRLVAEQVDPAARSAWEGDRFHLESSRDAEGLVRFILEEYRPTPILAPWNGGSGFWDNKAAGQALRRVAESTSPRLAFYRETMSAITDVIRELELAKSQLQDKKVKSRFVRRLRSILPEETLGWMDALAVITAGDTRFVPAPLLGTGANDGNLDFTKNFMERLSSVLPFHLPETGSVRPRGKRIRAGEPDLVWSRACLEAALFGKGHPALETAALGQFHPGGAGGVNAAQGFEGGSLVNPWDYILMIEGSLVLAGAAARRLGTESGSRASFPFTVETSPVGSGTMADSEARTARAEIWLPLWNRPSTFTEVRHLFAEGRAQVGGRQARSGLDFARAVAGLGVDRGIAAFQRYAFVQRNGLAYLAAPLGRLPVRTRSDVFLIDELEPWLLDLRRVKEAPAALRFARRDLDESIFAYCERGGTERLQDVVAATGRVERAVAGSPGTRKLVRPLQQMSPRWLTACDDGSVEFRVAAAISSIRHERAGRIREQLEPVQLKHGRWEWTTGPAGPTLGEGRLSRDLASILERRQMEGARQNLSEIPIGADRAVSLADVWRYLTGQVDDRRLGDLIWGFAALRWTEEQDARPLGKAEPAPELDRSYALLKLLFLPGGLKMEAGQKPVPLKPEPAILSCLRAGRLDEAMQIAGRRLWASGIEPLGLAGRSRRALPRFTVAFEDMERLASALLIPVWETVRIAEMVLRVQTDDDLRSVRSERKGSEWISAR